MPSLISTDVAANYLRVTGPTYTESAGVRTYTGPFSNFGTRALEFYKVAIADVAVSYTAKNSAFQKALNGIAINAEIYWVGTPVNTTDDYFMVAIATDTDASSTEDRCRTLAEAIDAASGATVATVTTGTLTFA
jgi:hypothetical protein